MKTAFILSSAALALATLSACAPNQVSKPYFTSFYDTLSSPNSTSIETEVVVIEEAPPVAPTFTQQPIRNAFPPYPPQYYPIHHPIPPMAPIYPAPYPYPPSFQDPEISENIALPAETSDCDVSEYGLATAKLNMRSGPSINDAMVAVLPKGERGQIHYCNAGWCKLSYGGKEGFSSLSHLELILAPDPACYAVK